MTGAQLQLIPGGPAVGSLPVLQSRAIESVAAFAGLGRRTVEAAWAAGRDLQAVKDVSPHGSYRNWLAGVGIARETDRRLRTVYERYPEMTQLGSFETVAEALEPPHNRVGGVGGGSPEWYTPPSIIADVREVLGSIDLDPASCETANETVRATKWYGIDDDGLSQPWAGRIYLNPPYGSVLPWVRRFFDEPLHLGGCLMLPDNRRLQRRTTGAAKV